MDVDEYFNDLDEISPNREIDLARKNAGGRVSEEEGIRFKMQWAEEAIDEGRISGELGRRWTEEEAGTSQIGLKRAKQIGWEQPWTKSEGP